MTFALLFLGLVPTILKAIPGMPAAVMNLIGAGADAASAILGSGVVTEPSVQTALTAWLNIINVLKTNPAIPPATLAAIAELQKAVQAAVSNDADAAKAVNWTLTHQIATV